MKRSLALVIVISAAVVVLYLGIARVTQAQSPRANDYLTPQLRQQVDQLKRDAAAQPTNAQNVVGRGLLLWQWVNAYSLTGGPVPVNATQESDTGVRAKRFAAAGRAAGGSRERARVDR